MTEKNEMIFGVRAVIEAIQAGNYAGFYDNIYRHLRHGEPLLTDAADVLLVIRLIEAAWKSSKEGNVVKL